MGWEAYVKSFVHAVNIAHRAFPGEDDEWTQGIIRYVDRENGAICNEARSDSWFLEFLYGPGCLSQLCRSLVRLPSISALYSRRYYHPVSREQLLQFIEEWGIAADEAEKPIHTYETINDFFYRRLKPGLRPVEQDPARLVSPADAKVFIFPQLEGHSMPVKGKRYSLAALLADAELARRFENGHVAVFRLAPEDYHRFHFPADGEAGNPLKIPGALDSVSPYALRWDPQVYCFNQRELVPLQSDKFGTILLLAVGAMFVGTIVQTFTPGRVRKGAEQGYFCFGGSALVMVLEKGRVVFDRDLIANSHAGLETKVKTGTGIGTCVERINRR